MTDAMWNALAIVLVAILGVIGGRVNTKVAAEKAATKTSELTCYRIDKLEEKVDKHNQVIVRTFKLEEGQAVLCEQLKVANHRIEDLERVR